MDEYKIKITRPESNYWIFNFASNEEDLNLFASNFMHPINSLLYSVRMLLKGSTKSEVSLIDEPGQYVIDLERIDETLKIKVFSFKDFRGTNRNRELGNLMLSCLFNFDKFLNQIINSLYPLTSDKEILLNEVVELRKMGYDKK